MEALIIETRMGPPCTLGVYMQGDWKAAMCCPEKRHLCMSAAVAAGRQARHLCLHDQGLLTLHVSLPQYLKCIAVKSSFLLYWAYSSLLPSNLQTFFHPQTQLYPVGRGNLGQVTLSFCAFLSPVHERIIISLCRWGLLLHPLPQHVMIPHHLARFCKE